ncbi:carboxylesterase/lipase family protein [Arthrobacter nitrophenolicus]|uniref:Carboxylic ester hydrolase n=1 Tax=Arthrobacter nitrophenolicus TaxID=683150 RepID=A0A4R5XT61_9MICC|nr:carboxylesterase family protein [Arthrobacter nitrophenolicus]TDL33987.1 carboxylesterase/lipase family protein [Arthrobacter nitrophenolicus]
MLNPVPTQLGPVQGREESGVRSWLGIPYAAPPWGQHRFAPPQPPTPWKTVRDACSYGPPAPQGLQLPGSDIAPSTDPAPDCLTVNVWAPTPTPEPLPVMVWFHGGAYLAGAGSEKAYNGTSLVREGVLLVTVNYRMGVDGFGQIDGAVSNRGILDQIAALEWVRDNIAGFGGDPQKVTIFGESSGAGCVLAMLTMPCARGLFHRAIAQSIPRMFLTQPLAHSVTQAVAAAAGIEGTANSSSLEKLSPHALADATRLVMSTMGNRADEWGTLALSPSPFGPVVDGATLPEDPWTALRNGAAREIPMITGHTRDEYRIFTAQQKRFNITSDEADTALHVFAPNGDADSYRAIMPEAQPGELYEKVITDHLFLAPTLQAAIAATDAGGRAFVYELCIDPIGGIGSPHAIDLPLTFNTLDTGMGALIPEPTDSVIESGVRMRSAWTRFAATGNPGWPQWGPDQSVQIWGGENPVTRYPEAKRLELSLTDNCGALELLQYQELGR